MPLRARHPRFWSEVVIETRIQRFDACEGVANDRAVSALHGVPSVGVHQDESRIGISEQRPRSGREILQAGPDGHNDIGLLSHFIGG